LRLDGTDDSVKGTRLTIRHFPPLCLASCAAWLPVGVSGAGKVKLLRKTPARRRVELLPQIFRRISYSVESLGFKFVSHRPMTLLPEDIHDGPGKQADLLGQPDGRKTNLLQDAHGGLFLII
jgi:hypothetical protein